MQSKGERVYQLNLQLYPVTDKSIIVKDLIQTELNESNIEKHTPVDNPVDSTT